MRTPLNLILILVRLLSAMLLAGSLVSCKESVYANKDETATSETIVSTTAVAINASNKDAIDFNITCSSVAKKIFVTGALSTTIECEKGSFVKTLDFSAVPDGPVNLTFQPNMGPLVQISFLKDVIAPEISGLSDDLNPTSSKLWNWVCSNESQACNYRVVLNKSPVYIFTAEAFSPTKNLSKTSGHGTYYFHIQARDAAGNLSTSKTIRFVLSNPTPHSVFIENAGRTEIMSGTVNLQLFASSTHTQMYITNSPDCSAGGVWEAYSPQKTGWLLNSTQAGGTASVYAKFRTADLTETSCVSASVHWRNYFRQCVDTSANSDVGLLYDDGGPLGNYAANNNCEFEINFTAPLRVVLKSLRLNDGDRFSIYGSNLSYGFVGTATSGLTYESSSSPNGETNSEMISFVEDYTMIFQEGPVKIQFLTNSSGSDSGFEVYWTLLSNLPSAEPQGLTPANSVNIAAGAKSTATAEVPLHLTFGSLAEMYITNTPGCLSGGIWEDAENIKNWVLSSGDGVKTVYVKFRDTSLHETLCDSDTIILDQVPPLAPIIKWIGLGTKSDQTPALHFMGSDMGSGIQRFETRVVKASDNTIIKDWQELVTGDTLKNLSLLAEVDYYFELRAQDFSGHFSSITKSNLWKLKPSISLLRPAKLTFTESSSSVTFEIKSSIVAGAPILVPFATSGEATYPSDHNLADSTAIIPIGKDSVLVTFQPVDDDVPEAEERLRIHLLPSPQNQYQLEGYYNVEFLISANDGAAAMPIPTMISAGAGYTCALVSWGVQCWGHIDPDIFTISLADKISTPTWIIPASSGVTFIDSGQRHTCAVIDGGVKCWGSSTYGKLGGGSGSPPNKRTPVTAIAASGGATQVSAGYYSTCAVVNGGVKCWGNNQYGQIGDGTTTSSLTPVTAIAALSGVTKVDVGLSHACAIVNGGVQCWGQGQYGRLGYGGIADRLTPTTAIPAFSNVTDITAGYSSSCAVVSGGLKCWGSNLFGAAGLGNAKESLIPLDVFPAGSGVTSVHSGDFHTCAVVSGTVRCWGNNSDTQINADIDKYILFPIEVLPASFGSISVALGSGHTCALSTSGALCWGADNQSERGNGSKTYYDSPHTVIPANSAVTKIQSGGSTTCFTAQKKLYCFGPNYSGEVGDGTTTRKDKPVLALSFDDNEPFFSIGSVTCAINKQGLKCWGQNFAGQVGDRTLTNRSLPVTIFPENQQVTAVSTNYQHTCAVIAGGVKCWGNNQYGQIGIGTAELYIKQSEPVTVIPAGSNVTAVVTGGLHTCAIISGGLKCWGYNVFGQVGDGTLSVRNVPTTVLPPGSNVTSVVAGFNSTCAIINGVVKCWGFNNRGQLGDGTRTNRSVPTNLSPAQTDAAQISVNSAHGCLRTNTGAIKCWGQNHYGQIGDGTTTERPSVTQILAPGSGATDISAGGDHTCAVINAGIKCWGMAATGAIPDPHLIASPQWVYKFAP